MAEDNNELPDRADICHDDIPEQPQRFIPDPSFPVKFPLLETPNLDNLLNRLADQNRRQDLDDNAIPPPEVESENEGVDQEVENADNGGGIRPCGGDLPPCPEGQVCLNGRCVDANAAEGNIVTSDDLTSTMSDGVVTKQDPSTGVGDLISNLDRSKKLFESVRYIPDFPGGSKYKFFTSANKKIKLFLPQTESISSIDTFNKCKLVYSYLNKINTLIKTIDSIDSGNENITLDQFVGNDPGNRSRLYTLLNTNLGLDGVLTQEDFLAGIDEEVARIMTEIDQSILRSYVIIPTSYFNRITSYSCM